jgi:hypothetical protein
MGRPPPDASFIAAQSKLMTEKDRVIRDCRIV